MNSLELYDTYAPYYAGRERLAPTRRRESADNRRDRQESEESAGEASDAHDSA